PTARPSAASTQISRWASGATVPAATSTGGRSTAPAGSSAIWLKSGVSPGRPRGSGTWSVRRRSFGRCMPIPVSKGVRGAEDRGGSRQTGGLAPLRQGLYSAAIARLIRILLDQMRRRIDHLDRVGDRVHPRGRGVAQAARDDAG